MPCNQRRTAHWIRNAATKAATSALIALGALSTSLLPAVAQAREFVSIKGKSVNVREKPSTRSATLWELSRGYPLQITQRQGQWLRVKDHEATLGWVHAPLTGKAPHMMVTARSANLRSGPGPKHGRVGRLEQHELLRTLKKQGGWVQVQRDNGQSGWVAKSLVWGW
ncbi:SH3 domain-containing protein [Comamonas guangdongensis]|uniref:SH3 domain-containing protein n=1 Tax=Comamonas guangdongensis TaxID=510515 RepID=A0ABV3ZZR3_9BURK